MKRSNALMPHTGSRSKNCTNKPNPDNSAWTSWRKGECNPLPRTSRRAAKPSACRKNATSAKVNQPPWDDDESHRRTHVGLAWYKTRLIQTLKGEGLLREKKTRSRHRMCRQSVREQKKLAACSLAFLIRTNARPRSAAKRGGQTPSDPQDKAGRGKDPQLRLQGTDRKPRRSKAAPARWKELLKNWTTDKYV